MPQSNLTAYYLTPAARSDLEEIWLYSVAQWSVDQANRYIRRNFRVAPSDA
ncbi:MAG: type II toxin-antitoxin system RelE/ParE family toxin [Roseovarius sp.]|nr:type II toxin-antitoxin system RelE/ParE family toxin [Roseovarius sp.]